MLILTRYAWIVSFILNILDHACTTCFVFANSFVNPFQSSFANSQRQMNTILWSIFKIWNFLPLFQMLFLWLNKTPPKWDSPLNVQEGFDISFLKYCFLPPFEHKKIPIENTLWKTKFLKLVVVVRSFCFGLILSPPLAWIAKSGIIRALEVLSSPLVINKWVKIIPKTKSFCSLPQRWRVTRSDDEGWVTEWKLLSSPKTPIPFQYSYDLVWNSLENTLVIAHERDMIKGI
jgi:hypothetical protein